MRPTIPFSSFSIPWYGVNLSTSLFRPFHETFNLSSHWNFFSAKDIVQPPSNLLIQSRCPTLNILCLHTRHFQYSIAFLHLASRFTQQVTVLPDVCKQNQKIRSSFYETSNFPIYFGFTILWRHSIFFGMISFSLSRSLFWTTSFSLVIGIKFSKTSNLQWFGGISTTLPGVCRFQIRPYSFRKAK